MNIYSGVGYYLVVYLLVKLLDRYSESKPVPVEAILRYQKGVARSLRILEETESTAEKTMPENVSVKKLFELTKDELFETGLATDELFEDGLSEINKHPTGAPLEQRRAQLTSKQSNSAYYFVDSDEVAARELARDQELMEHRKMFFLREDIPFNPDSKERFTYNAINVLGSYCGVALYTCLVADPSDVEFAPDLRWLAAMYASGISFATIVSTVVEENNNTFSFRSFSHVSNLFVSFDRSTCAPLLAPHWRRINSN